MRGEGWAGINTATGVWAGGRARKERKRDRNGQWKRRDRRERLRKVKPADKNGKVTVLKER